MASQDLLTYQDVLDHLVDFTRANPSDHVYRMCRRAISLSLQMLPSLHSWSYWSSDTRIFTNQPYSEGTVTYDHTGGDYERVITLANGSFPEWVDDGVISLSGRDYRIAERINATQLTLPVNNNPGADVASTTYTLYQDSYVLPTDFKKEHIVYQSDWGPLEYVHPREWLQTQRFYSSGATPPYIYTIKGSDNYQGLMDIAFSPYPDSEQAIDISYSRSGRQLKVEYEHRGTVSISEGSRAVNGTDTFFNDDMVGSIIRFSSTTTLPTGQSGANPYIIQRSIYNVVSSSQLEVDEPLQDTYGPVGYVISDPIDLEPGVMQPVFFRLCEAQLGKMAQLEGKTELEREFRAALAMAKDADSRSTSPRSVETGFIRYRTLADYPRGADVE